MDRVPVRVWGRDARQPRGPPPRAGLGLPRPPQQPPLLLVRALPQRRAHQTATARHRGLPARSVGILCGSLGECYLSTEWRSVLTGFSYEQVERDIEVEFA